MYDRCRNRTLAAIAGGLLIFVGPAAANAWLRQEAAAPEKLPGTEADARVRFHEAMKGDAALNGSWARLEFDGPRVTIHLTLDEARAKSQRSRIAVLAKKIFGANATIADDVEIRPFTRLIDAVQRTVEDTERLRGCLVRDGYFEEKQVGEAGETLHVLGRVVDERQRTEIHNLVLAAMKADPAWSAWPERNTIQTDGLVVQAPSAQLASYYFADGKRKYADGDFAGAAAMFTMAIAEAPDAPEFRYWRVVCALSEGDLESAKRQLRKMVKERGASGKMIPRTERVTRALEPIQGKLRWQLWDLEKQILSEPPKDVE